MEASEFNKVGCQPSDARRRRAAITRLLRMGVSDGAKSSSSEMAAMSELETELALLREENARLKVERHRPADAGHVIERMRSIRQEAQGAQRDEGPPSGADGGQALAECLALREGLMDACQEVQQAMRGIRGRLEALAGAIEGRAGDRATSEQLAVPTVQAARAEREDSDEDESELAQSVA
jgi:uncharacterized small protein (DUF1192 family)